MSTDLERALAEIAALGQRDASPAPVGRLLARLHRRRVARDVTVSAAGMGAAAALVLAGAATLGARDLDRVTVRFTRDPSGTTVHFGVTVLPETPGRPVDGRLDERTSRLDAEGRVARLVTGGPFRMTVID